jgi:hypothetical protein
MNPNKSINRRSILTRLLAFVSAWLLFVRKSVAGPLTDALQAVKRRYPLGAEATNVPEVPPLPAESPLPANVHGNAPRIAPNERKVIIGYCTHGFCPPCLRAQDDAKAGRLSVDVVWLPAPAWYLEYEKYDKERYGFPAFHWIDTDGHIRLESGYSDPADFEEMLREPYVCTKIAKGKLPGAVQRRWLGKGIVNLYTPHWTWPGNLAHHLTSFHRVSVQGLSHDQMEALHDSLHDGKIGAAHNILANPLRQRRRNRRRCPNGGC